VSTIEIVRLGGVKGVARFRDHVRQLSRNIPCDDELASGHDSPLRQMLTRQQVTIGNRLAVQPMEGWDGLADGNPSEHTFRRWRRFGSSGGKLIWGGEAVAVSQEGRGNPNQLLASEHTCLGLNRLRTVLVEEHRRVTGSDQGLLIGLQLTHSGRFSRPTSHERSEPRILYHHPILDRRLELPADYPILSDGEIKSIIEDFHRSASLAWKSGFDFVDIKHCHGYLGHEFLSAHTREGQYGGSFENRTRFLREIVEGIRSVAPGLAIGVRLSAFDTVPFRPSPALSPNDKQRPAISEISSELIPYRWGFGLNPLTPTQDDFSEPILFLSLLEKLNIRLVNLTAGSPYYSPHIQRPALFPPSDGYQPPEDPLIGVARQMKVTRLLKQRFPKLIFVGSAYSYLQDFLPHVAQAAVREGWVDMIGVGRMVLTYPELLWESSGGEPIRHKRICRTFSDCTTAPRKGLPSGCYPLDSYYKDSVLGQRLRVLKQS
jgi:NADPH2 dehydrogenase